jgi:innexin
MTQDKNDREGSVFFIARYLRKALVAQHSTSTGCFNRCKHSASNYCLWCGKHYGNYLIVLYLFCKLLYTANVIAQYFIMYRFLGTVHSWKYGFEYLHSLATGAYFDEMEAFPRETWCDVRIKRMYNDHRYTVQCTLHHRYL